MAKAAEKVTIKKYANRRLYDTESSTYITLDRLGQMIREGRDFEVLDAKSGEDITHQVLTQIIVEEESRGTTLLPVNFLRQLIGLYGGSMQNMVPQYLEQAMETFQRNHEAIRNAFGGTMLTELAKRNMAIIEDASRVFTGNAATKAAGNGTTDNSPAATPEPDDEVRKLREELAALQAKVEKLGR